MGAFHLMAHVQTLQYSRSPSIGEVMTHCIADDRFDLFGFNRPLVLPTRALDHALARRGKSCHGTRAELEQSTAGFNRTTWLADWMPTKSNWMDGSLCCFVPSPSVSGSKFRGCAGCVLWRLQSASNRNSEWALAELLQQMECFVI